MRKMIALFITGFSLWGCSSMSCCTLAEAPSALAGGKNGNMYDEVRLPVPSSKEAQAYLGLKEGGMTFVLPQVSADYLFVEIFSMSCPYCQRAAKQMNALFGLMESSGLSDKIKMMGIGMTNSEFEIEVYRKKFSVPYPLVADPDNKAYKLVGRVRIPHILILQRDAQGHYQQIYSKSHETRKADEIWKSLLEVTGLKGAQA